MSRWIEAAIAAGLIAVIVWIARHTYWEDVTFVTPPTGEAARDRYYSLAHLAAALGIETRLIGSLHAPPPDGIVLVGSLYDDLRHEPIQNLQAWVQSGGRLIIGGSTLAASETLQTWSGITLLHPAGGAPPPVPRALRSGPIAAPDCKPRSINIDGVPDGRSLILCNGLDPGLASGRSRIMVAVRCERDTGAARPDRPRRADRRRAGVHLEQRQSAGQGSRRDLHRRSGTQARRPSRDPEPHSRRTACRVALAAGGARDRVPRRCARIAHPETSAAVRPALPPAAVARRSLAEQIRANARFAWRTRRLGALRAAVRRALDQAAQKRIAGYTRMDPRRRALALSAATGVDADTLAAALLEDQAGGVNEHRAAITLLEACRRILIGANSIQRQRI